MCWWFQWRRLVVKILGYSSSLSPDPLSKAREDVTREKVDEYSLKLTLTDKLSCTTMLMEVGCYWSTNNPNELQRRVKKGVGKSSGNEMQITILASGHVTYVALPPMAIFQAACLIMISLKMKYLVPCLGCQIKVVLIRLSSFTGWVGENEQGKSVWLDIHTFFFQFYQNKENQCSRPPITSGKPMFQTADHVHIDSISSYHWAICYGSY